LRCQFQVVAPRQHGAGQAVRVGQVGVGAVFHSETLVPEGELGSGERGVVLHPLSIVRGSQSKECDCWTGLSVGTGCSRASKRPPG
jgi:hypothetical protein